MHHHTRNTIVIMEKENLPYPRCPNCDMFVLHKALNSRHLTTAFFRQEEERKRLRLVKEEARSGSEVEITSYGIFLVPITYFKYLGRVLLVVDNNCQAVVINLWHARQKWARLTRVLIREGADARTLGHIYLAVVQLVMIYGSKTWVTNPPSGRVLGGFHHRVAQSLTGRQHRKARDGVWVYPPLEDAIAEVRLQELETYLYFCKSIYTQFIATRPIMDLCLAVEQRTGSTVTKWW